MDLKTIEAVESLGLGLLLSNAVLQLCAAREKEGEARAALLETARDYLGWEVKREDMKTPGRGDAKEEGRQTEAGKEGKKHLWRGKGKTRVREENAEEILNTIDAGKGKKKRCLQCDLVKPLTVFKGGSGICVKCERENARKFGN